MKEGGARSGDSEGGEGRADYQATNNVAMKCKTQHNGPSEKVSIKVYNTTTIITHQSSPDSPDSPDSPPQASTRSTTMSTAVKIPRSDLLPVRAPVQLLPTSVTGTSTTKTSRVVSWGVLDEAAEHVRCFTRSMAVLFGLYFALKVIEHFEPASSSSTLYVLVHPRANRKRERVSN